MTHKAGTAVREMSNRWFESSYFFIYFSGILVWERLMCDGPGVADNRWIRGVFLILHQHFNYCSFTRRDWAEGVLLMRGTQMQQRWERRVLPYGQTTPEVQAGRPKQKLLYSAPILM